MTARQTWDVFESLLHIKDLVTGKAVYYCLGTKSVIGNDLENAAYNAFFICRFSVTADTQYYISFTCTTSWVHVILAYEVCRIASYISCREDHVGWSPRSHGRCLGRVRDILRVMGSHFSLWLLCSSVNWGTVYCPTFSLLVTKETKGKAMGRQALQKPSLATLSPHVS